MRLDKFLVECGVGSRKEVKAYIKNGRVSINDTLAKKSDMSVNEYEDKICLDSVELCYKKFIYLMLNKPGGYVSATYDKKLPVVVELVPENFAHYNPFPIGRLDIDTTGLLILTNDGEMAHRLTSPKHHANKIYYAKVLGKVCEEDVKIFFDGVVLDDGYECMSADLHIISGGEISEVELTVREGKFHQVKRMFEAVGKKVIELKRIEMGGVELDKKLGAGEIRELSESEIERLKSI